MRALCKNFLNVVQLFLFGISFDSRDTKLAVRKWFASLGWRHLREISKILSAIGLEQPIYAKTLYINSERIAFSWFSKEEDIVEVWLEKPGSIFHNQIIICFNKDQFMFKVNNKNSKGDLVYLFAHQYKSSNQELLVQFSQDLTIKLWQGNDYLHIFIDSFEDNGYVDLLERHLLRLSSVELSVTNKVFDDLVSILGLNLKTGFLSWCPELKVEFYHNYKKGDKIPDSEFCLSSGYVKRYAVFSHNTTLALDRRNDHYGVQYIDKRLSIIVSRDYLNQGLWKVEVTVGSLYNLPTKHLKAVQREILQYAPYIQKAVAAQNLKNVEGSSS